MPTEFRSVAHVSGGDIPTNLLEAFHSKHGVVAFVGSGPSCDAGLPSWPELLRLVAAAEGLDRDVRRHIDSGKFIDAAQYLAKHRSQRGLQEQVAQVIKRASVAPGLLHKLIMALPFAGVVTTNYDLLLTAADAPHRFKLPITYRTSGLRYHLQEPFVLHLHGHVGDPETIVITRRGYDDMALENEEIRQFVSAVFHAHTVLFVGFGFADPNVDAILSYLDHLKVIGGSTVFALVPSRSTIDLAYDEALRTRAVNPIYILDQGDYGTRQLKRWLRRLAKVLTRIRLSEAQAVSKLRPFYVRQRLRDLLASDEWLPLVSEAISSLTDRPDLVMLVRAGLRMRDVDGLFDRLGLDEMRTTLMFICRTRCDPILKDALSCFPPTTDSP